MAEKSSQVEPTPGVPSSAPAWSSARDITIVRAGALGDLLVTLPAIRALVSHDRRLRLIGHATAAGALAPDLFASIQSIEDPRVGFLFDDRAQAETNEKGAAIVIVRDPAIERRVAASGWTPSLFVPAHPGPDSPLTVAEHLLCGVTGAIVGNLRGSIPVDAITPTLSQGAPAIRETARPTIRVDALTIAQANDVRAVRGIGPAYATIHPGSGSPLKNWPADRFVAIAKRLRQQGIEPIVVIGHADATVGKRLRGEGLSTFADDLDLPTLAGLISGARIHIGNDSGIGHLAAGLGTPTVIVYGPTRATRWRPAGPSVVTVEPQRRCELCTFSERLPVACDCLMTVSVEAVWTTIAAVLDKEDS